MKAIAALKRNSRWTRRPTLGARKTARLSPHDIAIFAVLARYRYLPADYIHALVGGSFKHLIHRLNVLCREPNIFVIRPAQQRANANANFRPLIYELDERGARALQERGVEHQRTRSPASFAHELMVCQTMASFELGARPTNVRVITWNDILRSERLPETTRRSPKPFHLPVTVTVTVDGQQLDTHIAADGHP